MSHRCLLSPYSEPGEDDITLHHCNPHTHLPIKKGKREAGHQQGLACDGGLRPLHCTGLRSTVHFSSLLFRCWRAYTVAEILQFSPSQQLWCSAGKWSSPMILCRELASAYRVLWGSHRGWRKVEKGGMCACVYVAGGREGKGVDSKGRRNRRG